MPRVTATITTSLDGYITGPNDSPERGLGEGGERLHYWVFGGPWTYANPERGEPSGADREYIGAMMSGIGAVIGGRGTYWAADAWGGHNPFGVPFFVITHHPEEEPEGAGFTFVGSFEEALDRARAAAGDKDVTVMGGADTIRQALRAGVVDELGISVAPVVLGGGKALWAGFDAPLELEPIAVRQSRWATHVTYRVRR